MNSFTSWDSELYHHGILGQKWGIRRLQNEDGTLTNAGKQRYDSGSDRSEHMTKAGRLRDKTYQDLKKKYGYRGANYIERQMTKKGKGYEEAQKSYKKAKVVHTVALWAITDQLVFKGAIRKTAGKIVSKAAKAAYSSASKSAAAARGKRRMSKIMGSVAVPLKKGEFRVS